VELGGLQGKGSPRKLFFIPSPLINYILALKIKEIKFCPYNFFFYNLALTN
jgi:hypothetical protein